MNRHPTKNAFVLLTAAGLLCGAGLVQANQPTAGASLLDQALAGYDAAVTGDTLTPVAKLTAPVTLDGTAGSEFDFGATFGDATLEFILEGDPSLNVSAYLAVGEVTGSNLRYELWNNTGQLGFTQLGVADYNFSPGVPSPTAPTHVAYVWNPDLLTMQVFINGILRGTRQNVSDSFVMPSGPGWLGSTPTGAEPMKGTIYRVTVYDELLSDEAVLRHAQGFAAAFPSIGSFTSSAPSIAAGGSATLKWEVQRADALFLNGANVTGTTEQTVTPVVSTAYTLIASNSLATATATVRVYVDPPLGPYDAAITADTASGLTPLTTLTQPVMLTGAGGEPFDFGGNSGDVTMEFIMEGDPVATGDSGYLAVGENATSNLRFDQWQNTAQVGFTQLGVADYLFSPGVPSPTIPTHLTFVWNATTLSMTLYVNGVSAGTVPNVSDAFAMPTGMGSLGANPGGGEATVGRVLRVVVYDDILTEAAIQRHANAFTSALRPALITSFTATPPQLVGQGSVVLNWQVENATAVLLDGVDVGSATSRTVSPEVTTTYTLTASNNLGSTTAKVTVNVSPPLGDYDAAIAADSVTPVARLTEAVILNGTAGVPFDFGATSGDVTMEFILEGDITLNNSAYLAVGENPDSNLRYELWDNTAHLGFTQLRVADYEFSPLVPSPSRPTHVTYVWDSAAFTMKIYVNGVLAGTRTDVSDIFVMPSGQGWLGSTATGAETMRGTIYRVTVYQGMLPDATILRHADALMAEAQPVLHAYDLAVRGGTTALASVLAPMALPPTGGVAFDFGAVAGDATFEFVLEGDPSAAISANLAVGVDAPSRLRYEVWNDTTQMGFTQIGVADYVFTPPVASPTRATHVTYRWNSATATMQAYVNGAPAGSVTGVSPSFVMPSGLGRLGANGDGSEPMRGTIHRVTVYGGLLADDVILAHGQRFAPSVGGGANLAVSLTAATPTLVLSQLTPGAHYRVEYADAISGPWQLLQDIPSASGTTTTVTDTTPWAGRPHRFYRVQ